MELMKVELFEQIRRDFYLLEKSIRQIARERQIHRREVRSAVADAVPPKRKQMERNAPVLTLLLRAVVDDILKTDLGHLFPCYIRSYGDRNEQRCPERTDGLLLELRNSAHPAQPVPHRHSLSGYLKVLAASRPVTRRSLGKPLVELFHATCANNKDKGNPG